jgi:hypothetical protein
MSHQIAYRAGTPHKFIATRSFSLGNTGQTVPDGAEIEFDGSVVSYAGLAPVSMPQLRGAVKMGWLVLADDFDPMAPPPPPQMAGIQMRAADGGNPMDPKPRREVTAATVEDEEREVANVSQHAARTAARNQTNYRRGSENRALPAGSVIVEEQDGIPVRTLNTPTQTGGDVTQARSAIAAAKAAAKIKPGEGQTREQMIAKMSDEERAEYAQDVGARTAAYDPERAAQVVAQIDSGPRTVEREGMKVTNEVGGGTAITDLGGTGATPGTEVVVEEGVKFTRTKGVKKPTPPSAGNGDTEQARIIARSICKDFPDNYVFSDPIRKKIARLQADYDDRPDIIKAVAAADTDPDVRAKLLKEFPEAFGE